MKLEQTAYAYIRQCQLYPKHARVVVACSGGIDSMVLLDYFRTQRSLLGVQSIAAIHVNHMLRGDESDGDAAFVAAYCERYNIPLYTKAVPIAQMATVEQGNIEAIARRERYRFFEQVMQAQSFDALVLAHHADDQIENVIMALTRGLQQGTLGMPTCRTFASGVLTRPFLSTTRAQIEQYAAEQQITHREDASNAQDDYVRNRIRHHVVPLLRNENPNVANAVRIFTEHRQQDEQFLQQMAQAAYDDVVCLSTKHLIGIDVNRLQLHALALQRRIIQLLLKYLYKDRTIVQSYTLLERVLKLASTNSGNAEVQLPEGFVARRHYDELIIDKAKSIQPNFEGNVPFNEWVKLGQHLYLCVTTAFDTYVEGAQRYYANRASLGQLRIRTRQNGDRIHVLGMTSAKKVSRIFIDAKVPDTERATWPLLVNDDDVLAVVGLRMSHHFSRTKRATDDVAVMIAPSL